MQHPAERAGGVTAATEAEDVDAITWLEGAHQELVSVRYVVGDSIPEGETDYLCPPLPNAGKSASRTHGAYARMVIGDLGSIANKSPIQLNDVGVFLAELVTGPVTTHDDVLGHSRPLKATYRDPPTDHPETLRSV